MSWVELPAHSLDHRRRLRRGPHRQRRPADWSPAGSSASWSRRTTASSRARSLAEIDPIPYRDKVNIARAKLDAAQAELARQRADLDRVRKEVPIQIEIARRTLAAAEADRAKAEESLKLTRDEVEKGIDEARAGVKAAQGPPDAGRAGVHTLHPARADRGPARCSGSSR